MSNYSTAIIKNGPVAYYRVDESSGTVAHDQSGNSYNGTISGSGITYSKAGAISGDPDTAFLLNGTSGKITLPGGTNPVGWASITCELWVKLTSNSFGHKGTLFATGTTPTNRGDGFKFWIGNNGTNGGFAVGVSGDRWAQATFSKTFTAGVWYHIAGTWDGSTVRVYVNGVQNGSTGSVSGSIDGTGFNVTLGQDPQLGGDWLPATIDEPALYSKALTLAQIQADYAQGLGQVAPPTGFITNTPGNVSLLINDVWYPAIRQESIKIDRTASDPIPTFTFDLQDDPSHIPISELQEIVFLDTGQIPNPTHNLLTNPILNPYATNWFQSGGSGVTFAQNTGGGVKLTFANAAASTYFLSQTTPQLGLVPGQSYMGSVQFQATSPVNLVGWLEIIIFDVNGNSLAGYISAVTSSTTLTQLTLSFIVPATASYVQFAFFTQTSSGTNSGSVTFTQPQLEPMCFTSGNYQISYPTPWCASGQTNCFVLPDGTTVRQLRLFGGVVTKATAGSYVGNNRRWTVTASGYGWLLQKQLLNTSWTAIADSAIIGQIVSTYFPTTFSTAQVVQGAVYSGTLAYAYDGTARDAFDALAANASYIYYADAYRTLWYQPPGYNTLPFALSDSPDHITSFEYYNYKRDVDGTQLGNATFVAGATNIAAIEYDAQSIALYNQKTNGQGTFWRSVSDSSILSTPDAQSRAIGETGQYGYARPILHLSTNQFMVPGYTVLFTSTTDGLYQVPYLIQKAALLLMGFQSLFQAVYECQCDLGAFNPDLINIHAKILRRQVAKNSAPQGSYYGPVTAPTPAIGVMATDQFQYRDSCVPAITQTTPVPGIAATWYGSAGAVYGSNLVGYGNQGGPSSYAATILADTPLRYYRLDETSGTTANDLSTSGINGTLSGGITLTHTGLLVGDSDSAMLFNGSTGTISFADTGLPSGANPWTLEAWITLSSFANFPVIIFYGSTGTNAGAVLWVNTSNSTINLGFQNAGNAQGAVLSLGTIYHVVGTYDGSVLRLYVNGNLSASVATTGAILLFQGSIGSQLGSSEFTSGLIDEPALYNYALSPAQVTAHYSAGNGPLSPLGPAGNWTLAWHDEFDDTTGMSGPTNGLSAAHWNGGWFSGPSSPGVGTNVVTDPINTGTVVNYFGPASIAFPGDGAVHLRLQNGVDNGGTFNTRTKESGIITTAGLMALNPGSVPVSTSSPDLRPYTLNGPLVLEVRMRVPGPNGSAAGYWPGVFLTNAGNYGGTSPNGTQWPGGQTYAEEIDLVEMAGGGALGSSSALNFHAASSYAASGIPTSLSATDLSLGYHTYTYLFTQNTLQVWVDGIPAVATPATVAQVLAQWQYPQYLLIDFQAVAGAVLPTTAAGSPSDFMIDYVRVWQAG